MARPRQPLISRSAAAAAALHIIDTEGLDALSLPRLARDLKVSAPSLYHHFEDKSAILAAVSRAIVAEIKVPRKPAPENWPEWFVQMSLNFRTVVFRHRNAAPLLLQYRPRLRLTGYDDAAEFLAECGVPVHLHVQILEGMETLTLGATLTEAMKASNSRKPAFPHLDAKRQPHLAAAIAANEFTQKRVFENMIRSYLYGVIQLDGGRAKVDAALAGA
ncbi:TetR family transcriptional regulator [Actinomadura geliboluensis]|uniref:TetR family transcriptional regulator n=1 Tax=Actinomadura geliboluensis TaxID=882440 RepID=UPI003723B95B